MEKKNLKLSTWMKVTKLAAVIAMGGATGAEAQQDMQMCLRYENTGQKYLVNGALWYGSELTRATGAAYLQNHLYAVVFWDRNQASVILLDYNVRPTTYGHGGTDQQGQRWSVARATSSCLNTQ